MATLFGPGNFVDDEGNAVIPEHWRTAIHWYQDAMWTEGFHPNGPLRQQCRIRRDELV